jgi:integrase
MGTAMGCTGSTDDSMARGINRLPASYKNAKPGMHCDGGCLYLQVTEGAERNRRRSWIFRYRLSGRKPRDMGLGSIFDVTLAEARERARQYRNLVKDGIDPIEHRNARVAENLAATARVMTFDAAADAYIRHHRAGWKNTVHAAQWPSTLKAYASPVLGKLSVADIETAHIRKVLDPIWHDKPETASRVRSRIEAVLAWSIVSGYRTGDNPARWRGHLDKMYPAKSKLRPVRHQKALPYAEMPTFLVELRQRTGMAALALEFAVLTCVRTADVRNASLADMDVQAKIWTIRALSKTGKEHRVPLSDAAVAVFERAHTMAHDIRGAVGKSELAFPNDVTGARLSENAMLAVLDRMGRRGQMTTHGCRSTFRTWAQEQTSFTWEVAEMALGHAVGSKVERAYARGDALKKRVAIMQSWANYLARPPQAGKGIPLQGRSG